MGKKHSKQITPLHENASAPEQRQALERDIDYSEQARDNFYKWYKKVLELNIDDRGVLAGPVRKMTVEGGNQLIRKKSSED